MDTTPSPTRLARTPDAARGAARPERVPPSIRLLRRLNPLIRALLRSPLHGLLSGDLLVLAYHGVKSGTRRELPLSYVEHDGGIYLCTRSSLWPRNLRGRPDVEVWLRGRRVDATARVLEPASTEARDALRAFLTRNPRTGEILYDVGRDGGRPRETDVVRETPRSTVVRLDLGG